MDMETHDLMAAQGLALALIGSLLEGAQVIPRGEFSQQLALLADVTDETQPVQGAILDKWAALAAQVAAHGKTPN